MPNTATRLLTLILLLQRRPNQKAAELAEALGISVRSLHRYMAMLDEMGIPIFTERGPYGGFSLVRGYRMPPLVFTPEEAAALSLGTGLAADLFGALYRDAAHSAQVKLDNVLPEDQRREVAWARQKLVATGLHRSDLEKLAPRLELLRQAVRDGRQVEMVYGSAGKTEPSRRTVDPYALVFRWGWWYAVGHCHLRQGLRSFRVDRMFELRVLEAAFETPVGFDVRSYLAAEFQSQPALRMRLRFLPEFAFLARDSAAAWESLEDRPDGAVEVCVAVPDPAWGASTAMSFGAAVVVIEPPEIRRLVRQWALAVAGQYAVDEQSFEEKVQ